MIVHQQDSPFVVASACWSRVSSRPASGGGSTQFMTVPPLFRGPNELRADGARAVVHVLESVRSRRASFFESPTIVFDAEQPGLPTEETTILEAFP
jgi:hypothetical protein